MKKLTILFISLGFSFNAFALTGANYKTQNQSELSQQITKADATKAKKPRRPKPNPNSTK